MKILFVDNSADLQQKWIDPLRADGWGALRARSAEDADRMLALHGDSIEIVVVCESLVQWAEKQEFPFIVLTKTWQEKDVLAHQNSKRSAFFYQSFEGRVPDLMTAVYSYRSGGPVGEKNEHTQWTATKTIALEDFTNVLTQPEVTKSHSIESSIKLDAPSVLFGGESTNAGQNAAAPDRSDKTTISPTPIQTQSPSPGLNLTIDFGKSKPAEAAKPAAPAASADSTRVSALPEVMEVKLDVEPEPGPAEATRISIDIGAAAAKEISIDPHGSAEATRISTGIHIEPSAPLSTSTNVAQKRPADSTIVLESTKVELTNGEEISQQLDAMAEEQELVGELSINEEVSLRDVVGGTPITRSNPMPPPPVMSATQVQSGAGTVQQPVYQAPPVVRVIEGDEALKNYLALREQDVAVLTGQVRSSQERVAQLEAALKVEKARSTELQHMVQKQEQQLKNYDQDKQVEIEVLYRQVEDLNHQLQERTNKAHTIEAKLRLTTEEVNKIKERVRVDVRRIRVREKELESQLEILKKDSAALLQARDEKILELKRKLDLLEFNMELIQEQYSKERQSTEDLRNRLKDAAKAMRQAGGLLEQ